VAAIGTVARCCDEGGSTILTRAASRRASESEVAQGVSLQNRTRTEPATGPKDVTGRWLFFSVVVGAAVALDAATKAWALAGLEPGQTEHALGGLLPLTLGFNRGIAFGLHVGPSSRFVFTLLAVLVLAAAIALYRATPMQRRWQRLALCFMCAGAIGNLLDRLLRDRGVVDFIGPYDLGFMVWPIFNLADVWVVIGTLGYAAALWRTPHAVHEPPGPSSTTPA
jgi:signal peptidase II